MSDLAGAIEAAVGGGQADRCAELFLGMPEPDRRACAPTVVKLFRAIDSEPFEERQEPDGRVVWSRPPGYFERADAARVAVIGACSLAEIKRLGFWAAPRTEQHFELLADRRPSWTQDLAEWMVEQNPNDAETVSAMAAMGLCETPDADAYYLGLISGWVRRSWKGPSIADRIRADETFREKHLWRLLAVEGGGEFSLAAVDKYTQEDSSWTFGLIRCAGEGVLPRDRLLDAALDSLDRDFAQFRAGWFSRFHEKMEPTLQERSARVERYLRLLASTIPPTVTFALNALAVLDKAKALDPRALIDQVRPALDAKAKTSVNKALRLIKNAVKREPALQVDAGVVVARALLHEKADVQKAALDCIEAWDVAADAAVQEELALAADAVAPSLRKRLRGLLHAPSPAEATPESDVAPATRDDRDRSVSPITSLPELLEQYAYVLENPGDPVAVERVLGGLARLGTERPDGFEDLAGPLAKRAMKLMDGHSEDWTVKDLAWLVAAWIARKPFRPEKMRLTGMWSWKAASTCDLFRERIRPLAERLLAGSPAPLLSEITHERGWIEPGIAVERTLQQERTGSTTDVADQVLALLRLGLEGRPQALQAAKAIKGEFGEALRFALGAPKAKVGKTAPLWVAAARARDPLATHAAISKKFKKLGAGAAGPGECTARIHTWGQQYTWHRFEIDHAPERSAELDWAMPTVLMHAAGEGRYLDMTLGGVCGFEESCVRWAALIAPGCTEDYFEVACQRLDLEWSQVQWEARCFFEPLLAPDTRLGPWAYRLMALGLSAKESGQHGMATDACIAAIDDGRLEPGAFAVELALLWPTGIVKPGRWTKTLGEVSHAGPRHAAAVRALIQGALRGDPADPPKDAAKLLELLYELSVEAEARVEDPEARAYLEGLTRGGKTAKFRKLLLAL